MAGDESFYEGAGYGIKPSYGDTFMGEEYRVPASSFALTVPATTANQLKEVSTKLNTGARTLEVGPIQPEVFEVIPKQHFEELNRLKKLAGVDLTLHGPLIEASGITDRGVGETMRKKAEMQMVNVLEQANKLDPSGNVVVTFHSTAGLPEMMTRVKGVDEQGNPKEKVTEILVINEREGGIDRLKPKVNYLEGQKEADVTKELNKLNEERWVSQLSTTGYHAEQGKGSVIAALQRSLESKKEGEVPSIIEAYNKYGTDEWQDFVKDKTAAERQYLENDIQKLNYGDIYVRDAYGELQNLFNQAWEASQKSKNKQDLEKLEKVKKEIQQSRAAYAQNKANLPAFADDILKGVKTLNNLSSAPKVFIPLQDYAMEKSSETFGNVALETFKKFKDNSPIISIENVPVGMGIARAEDLRKLIDKSRDQFVQKAVSELDMSESEARQQAEKLIGATWDVGHINMLRQHGFGDKEIVEETEKIKKYVNKIHLSDNFGFEHTELPMGMGNVPLKEHLGKLKKEHGEALDKIKKVIETGTWYQHFQTSPFKKTLEAFGSPIYGMQMAPYWNQSPAMNNSYFSGYGMMLPDQHFSMYGAGFSSLPTELGGQTSGRSRLSGAPME